MTVSVFNVNDASLVPILTEWLTLLEYLRLLQSLGRNEKVRLRVIYQRYQNSFQNFVLNTKSSINALKLWSAIAAGHIQYLDPPNAYKSTLVVAATIDKLPKTFETDPSFLKFISKFDKIKIDIPFLDRANYIPRIVDVFINQCGSHIVSLDISGRVTDNLSRYLDSLPYLTELSIVCPQRSTLCTVIVHARTIQSLKVRGPKLKSRDISMLALHGTKLTEFSSSVTNSDISVKSIMWYVGNKLAMLNLENFCGMTIKILEAELFRHIRSLTLSFCKKLTQNELFYLIKGIDNLETFKFSNSQLITIHGVLSSIARCTHLKTLHVESISTLGSEHSFVGFTCQQLSVIVLRDVNLTDDLLLDLIRAQAVGLITTLDISKNSRLTHFTLTQVVRHLRSVQDLNICYCAATDEVAKIIAEVCEDLQSLDVTGCNLISDNGMKFILQISCLHTLLMEYLEACDIDLVVKKIIEHNLLLRKLRISNRSPVNRRIFEGKLKAYSYVTDLFIGPFEATTVKNRVEKEPESSSVMVQVTQPVFSLDYMDDEY